jgi:hypothetical protein
LEKDMADITVTETTVKTAPDLFKSITLTAGDKLGDDADLTAWAAETCPAGCEVDVRIRVQITAIRTV